MLKKGQGEGWHKYQQDLLPLGSARAVLWVTTQRVLRVYCQKGMQVFNMDIITWR